MSVPHALNAFALLFLLPTLIADQVTAVREQVVIVPPIEATAEEPEEPEDEDPAPEPEPEPEVPDAVPAKKSAPPPDPEPDPEPAAPASGVPWDRIAECESNQTWDVNTGNGYYGGLQFDLRSWEWAGGTGMPHEASREEQIARAERLLELRAQAGLEPLAGWPACTRKLELR